MSARSQRFSCALAVLAALLVAGCGGSSGGAHSSSSTAATSSTTSHRSATSNPTGPTLSRSAYQSKAAAALRPWLVALQGVEGNELQPRGWQHLSTVTEHSRQAIASLTPPSDVADLQPQLLSAMDTLVKDADQVQSDLTSKDGAALEQDGAAVKQVGAQLKAIAASYRSRGYQQLAILLQ